MRRLLAALASLACIFGKTGIAKARTPDPGSFMEVKANGYWGVVDRSGKVILPFEFDDLYVSDDGIIATIQGDDERYFDTAGRQVPYCADADRNGYFPVEVEGGGKGLVDERGYQIVPAVYEEIAPFDNAGHYVVYYGGRASVIDVTGKPLFHQTFYRISELAKNGLAIAMPDVRTYGAIDRTGAWVIEPGRFEEIVEFSDDGLASARSGGKWGFIDGTGHWAIAPVSEDDLRIWPFNKLGTTAVKIGGKWGFIDRSGRMVVEPQFDYITRPDDEETYVVEIDAGMGLIDGRGRKLFEHTYAELDSFSSEGLAKACEGDRWFIIDRKGRPVFGDRFEDVGPFRGGGWAPAQSGGKWGAIDTSGNWILEPIYEGIGEYARGD